MKTTKKSYDLQSLNFLKGSKLKIGLLGGSFNPAHKGHLHITEQAIKQLNLDYVIWLVALQNPLKPKYDFDIFSRANQALSVATNSKILVSTLEHDIGSGITYEVLKALHLTFKEVEFIWIMGADNLENFDKWDNYEGIAEICKIAVFPRPGTMVTPISFAGFVQKFKGLVAKNQMSNIMFYQGPTVDISSTEIRAKKLKE